MAATSRFLKYISVSKSSSFKYENTKNNIQTLHITELVSISPVKQEDSILETLHSTLLQIYKNIEPIVLNGGSTDNWPSPTKP